MRSSGSGRRLRLAAGAAVLLGALTGCATAPDGPPSPTASETAAAGPATPTPSTTPDPAPAAEPLPPEQELALGASRPVSLSIAKIGVETPLIETGLQPDRSLEVPPGDEGSPASWFRDSPTPGSRGPAVLLGHVNSLTDASGVFYRLRELAPGDTVTVSREDGSRATFEVYSSEIHPKDEFPTKAVYFPVRGAELRLITCGGYSEASSYYEDNLIVYAKLISTE